MKMVLLYIFIVYQTSDSNSTLFALDSVYYKYQVVYSDTSPYDSLFTPVPLDTITKDKDDLRISGTKDFLFDIDEGFNQGLKVNITGEVEGVRVEGNLSDRATATSTIQISEIEKMSLKVFTKNFYGGIGNLTIDLPFGVHDEIQGGRIVIHSEDKNKGIGVSYAVKRGIVKRVRFSGEEGKQSPYLLDGGMIAGSERVYLAQGITPAVLLKRDEDYTIDYERGILSFTNKKIITNRSRIEVEYQQAIEDYSNVYTESDGSVRAGNVEFVGMYRRRYDEKENPLTFTLSQAEIESLMTAGDSSVARHTYADTASDGAYIFEDDHFVYVGEGNGDYTVTFFHVGEGNGEYTYDPILKGFSYQGPGQGNYSPTKLTPLPEKDEFYGLGIDIFEILRLNMYGSHLDKNTFSPIDDDDNFGLGYSAHVSKTAGILRINGEYISYDKNFLMPHGKESFDYQYQWNATEPLEEMGNVALGITPTPFLQLDAAYGILNRKHKRKLITIRPFFFQFGYEGIDSINKYFAGMTKRQDKFLFNAQYENVQESHLFDYALRYFVAKNTTLGLSGSYDKDTTNRGITTALDMAAPPLSFSLGHRRYNDTTFLFGNANLNVCYKGAAVIGNLQQSQRYSQKKDETYVKVDEGEGDYVYDPITGAYIEREGGNYIRKVFLLQEFERVVSRNYNIELAYTKSLFDFSGRFYYANEKDFMSTTNDILFSVSDDVYDVEFNVRQEITEDARFALYTSSSRERLLSLAPSYRRLSCRAEVKERTEKYNELVREKKNSYAGEVTYRILSRPLLRPQAGYSFSKIFSNYFENLEVRLSTPNVSLLFGMPLKQKGRVELSGELIYRIYNIEEIPFFFAATEPPGLTKIAGATASVGIGSNTIFSLIYRLEFPPEDDLRQSLKFQTKIRF